MKKAFTLSEVLITLGIIGVVSAVTIPSLVNNIQDKHFKALLKKTYSDISNAYELASKETPIYAIDSRGRLIGDRTLVSKQAYYEIFSRLNTISFCVRDYLEDHSCIGDKNYIVSVPCTSLNGDLQGCAYDGGGGYAILTNGVRINAEYWLWDYPLFVIDVNGSKKPNVVGRDIFPIFIREKIIPAGAPGYEGLDKMGCDKKVKSTPGAYGAMAKSGAGCAYKYLYE